MGSIGRVLHRGCLASLAFVPLAAPVAANSPLAVCAARQPAPVRAFVERRLACNHWGGEEPYDQARTREIARAARALRCDRLERDEARLRQRYPADADLPALLDSVRDKWEL